MATTTKILGVLQSDVLIRGAMIAAMADIRANPFLLDYVFSGLVADTLTSTQYGQAEIDAAKKWFNATDIPVVMNFHMGAVKMPCLSISLLESVETEDTLGDVNYEPREETDGPWDILVGPFTPASYDYITGAITVPDDAPVNGLISIAPGMILVDKTGSSHPILTVTGANRFAVQANLNIDLNGATIRASRPSHMVHIESARFRETYSIGCHVQGEAVHLTYLHSIAVFCLLAYRESLLEARGFECSSLSSSDAQLNQTFEQELTYSRYIRVPGWIRQYWPKQISPKVTGVDVQTKILDSGSVGEGGLVIGIDDLALVDALGNKLI